jgi:tRNA threonylcarbamoyladenosine biosynthesis protein TsaE
MEIIYSLNNIEDVAKEIIALTGDNKIISFSGGLGAGKTTLIAAICKGLGASEIVSSPTFSLIQQYESGSGKKIYHMDLYRLKSSQEAIDAGIEDCLFSGEWCFVEWPENAIAIFPKKRIDISLHTLSSEERKLVAQLHQ